MVNSSAGSVVGLGGSPLTVRGHLGLGVAGDEDGRAIAPALATGHYCDLDLGELRQALVALVRLGCLRSSRVREPQLDEAILGVIAAPVDEGRVGEVAGEVDRVGAVLIVRRHGIDQAIVLEPLIREAEQHVPLLRLVAVLTALGRVAARLLEELEAAAGVADLDIGRARSPTTYRSPPRSPRCC